MTLNRSNCFNSSINRYAYHLHCKKHCSEKSYSEFLFLNSLYLFTRIKTTS